MLRLVGLQRSTTSLDEARESVGPIDPLAELVRTALAGDRDGQRTLLVALGPVMLRAVRGVLGARHPDVEDVLQDALAAVHAALSGFRGECQTHHFASRVAVQIALNARRRAGYRAHYTPCVAPDELSELAPDERSPEGAQAATARREALRRLLDELPTPQAEVIVLHTVLGHSVEETARATRAPINTVRSRLRAALSALRAKVNANDALLEVLDVKP